MRFPRNIGKPSPPVSILSFLSFFISAFERAFIFLSLDFAPNANMSPAERSSRMEKGGIFPPPSNNNRETALAFGGREGVYNIPVEWGKGGYCVSEGRVAEKSIYFP